MSQASNVIEMSEITTNFSKVANRCHDTNTPITVFKQDEPWVSIVPVGAKQVVAEDYAIEGVAAEGVIAEKSTASAMSLEDQMQLAMQQVGEGKVSSMNEFLATL